MKKKRNLVAGYSKSIKKIQPLLAKLNYNVWEPNSLVPRTHAQSEDLTKTHKNVNEISVWSCLQSQKLRALDCVWALAAKYVEGILDTHHKLWPSGMDKGVTLVAENVALTTKINTSIYMFIFI